MKRLNGSVRFDTFDFKSEKTQKTYRKYAIEIVLPADSEFTKHAALAAWNATLKASKKPLKTLDDVTDKLTENVRAKVAFYGFASSAPKCVGPMVPYLGKRSDGNPGIALKTSAPRFVAETEGVPDDWTKPYIELEKPVKVNKSEKDGKVTKFITMSVDNLTDWWKTAIDNMKIERSSETIDLSGDTVQQVEDDTPDASDENDESVPF